LAYKTRKTWLSGLLTFITIGLGHVYAGYPKKGVILFVGHISLMFLYSLLIRVYPSFITIIFSIITVIIYVIFCIYDALKKAKIRKSDYVLKPYNKWFIYLFLIIFSTFMAQPAVSYIIKKTLIQAYKIPAGSLKPTLLIGDHILAKKTLLSNSDIKHGDIIIFDYPKDPTKDFIKRVIACGGDTIEIINKKVFINGNPIDEPYAIHQDQKTHSYGDTLKPTQIPDDSFFVMGDNRDNSHDSRLWGFVNRSAIHGKASIIYWSWDTNNDKIRWDRIGKKIQ